jgi:aromatic ring-opening dioxygenase LigB subunit
VWPLHNGLTEQVDNSFQFYTLTPHAVRQRIKIEVKIQTEAEICGKANNQQNIQKNYKCYTNK